MKKIIVGVVTLFLFFANISVMAQQYDDVYFFYGQGCPHCANVEEYFEENGLIQKYDIQYKEIYFNSENALFFNQVMDEFRIPLAQRGVPTLVIGEKFIVGDQPIIAYFTSEADIADEQETGIEKGDVGDQRLNLTLPVVIGASLVDAINPCAFAVLILLMSTVLLSRDRKRSLYSGLSFSAAIFISYLLMGLGLYTALDVGGNIEFIFQNSRLVGDIIWSTQFKRLFLVWKRVSYGSANTLETKVKTAH